MPANLVKTAADEKHWDQAKEAYAQAQARRRKKGKGAIKNKWEYINGTMQHIKENASK
jgi:hypothetical protein